MKDREAWRAAVLGGTKSQTRLSDWRTTWHAGPYYPTQGLKPRCLRRKCNVSTTSPPDITNPPRNWNPDACGGSAKSQPWTTREVLGSHQFNWYVFFWLRGFLAFEINVVYTETCLTAASSWNTTQWHEIGPVSEKFTVSVSFCSHCKRTVLQLPSSHFTNGHLPAKSQTYHTFLS